jgi:biopolymer transport protein TolQ
LSQVDVLKLLLQETTVVAKAVLAILMIFSVVSWGIILSKTMLLRRVRRESETFWRIFRKGQSMSEIATASEALRFTPLVPVFNAGAERKTLSSIQRSVQRASSAQLTLLESRLNFLATTAAVAPFIGLFGTVWGVLTTFTGLSTSNVATLRAVAPGIADALVTTAFGLFTAIPAVIAYNHFVYQIRNVGGQMDELQVEMLAIGERSGL